MHILFCIRNSWYFRNVETTLRELMGRGHTITLVISSDLKVDEQTEETIRRFEDEQERLTLLRHRERADWWIGVVNTIRSATDLVHLRGEKFTGKERMQKRPWTRASLIVRSVVELAARSRFRPAVERSLAKLDSSIPPERRTLRLFRSLKPDVAVFTPLIDLGCNQNELLRAATANGIPTVLMVHSWDNLSTKSRLRTWPTRMIVWNEIQRREAEHFHGYPADRVAVSGAPLFDQWLAMRPKRTREEFLTSLGLDPAKPLILYLCSALFNDAPESDFFVRWARAIRGHGDPLLASANILVRVHPKRVGEIDRYELPELGNVVAWPKSSINPVGAEAKDNYVSSLTYADAMMAINTTAMIEAALLDKPVFTMLGTEHEISQTGTHHFNYLLNAGKGILRASYSMDEHVDWLRRTLAGEEPFTDAERSFVDMFVRPHGRGTSSTRTLCDEIEGVAAAPVATDHGAQPIHMGWHVAALSLATVLPPVLFCERVARKAVFEGRRALDHANHQVSQVFNGGKGVALSLVPASPVEPTESAPQHRPAETSSR